MPRGPLKLHGAVIHTVVSVTWREEDPIPKVLLARRMAEISFQMSCRVLGSCSKHEQLRGVSISVSRHKGRLVGYVELRAMFSSGAAYGFSYFTEGTVSWKLTFNGWLCMLTPTRARLPKQDVQTHSWRGYQNKMGTPIHAELTKT